MTTTYTTHGSIRGSCGHAHRTFAAAARCIAADQRGCERQGGYSDRRVQVMEDGERRALTDDEWDALEGGIA